MGKSLFMRMTDEKIDVDISSTILTYPVDVEFNAINYSFEQFIRLFRTASVDLSEFWLINVGFDSAGQRRYAYLIIRGYLVRPFYGPHLVSVESFQNGENVLTTLWVPSLTYLRREMFKFVDRLSFERSSYVAPYENGELLLRLKPIRAFLQVPNLKPKEHNESVARVVAPKPKDEGRLHELLSHNIQALITIISRERNCNLIESTNYFMQFSNLYCIDISRQINTPEI